MEETWTRCRLLGNSHAEVYLAADKITGHLFVVKTTDTERSRETAELLNEITIFLMLNSPRIVRYLGSSFTHEGDRTRLNLFVEYMPGGNLRNHIRRLRAPLADALVRKYTRSILEGLHHLHTRGIVHGDIKSDNVLVGLYEIKLADFGGSKLVGFRKSMKGTCAWMAPEVVAGVEQGLPSDIWSLGCTILEMTTGLDPWPQISQTKLLRRVIQYSSLIPTIPLTLSSEGQTFLRKCLVREPAKRCTTAQLLEDPFVKRMLPNPLLSSAMTAKNKARLPRTDQSEQKKCGDQVEDKIVKGPPVTDRIPDRLPVRHKHGNSQMKCNRPTPQGRRCGARRSAHIHETMASQHRKKEVAKSMPLCPGKNGMWPHSVIPADRWPPELDSLIALGLTKSEWDIVDNILLNLRNNDNDVHTLERTRGCCQGGTAR